MFRRFICLCQQPIVNNSFRQSNNTFLRTRPFVSNYANGTIQQSCDKLILRRLLLCELQPYTRRNPLILIQNQQSRYFRVSSPQNALPPIIVVVLGRVAKFGAVFLGRFARRWWRKLPPERKAELTGKANRNRNILWGLLGGLSFGVYVYYETHIQEAPITKRKRFVAFKDDQFSEISKQQLDMLLEEHKNEIIPAAISNPVYQRVVRVAQRLLNGNLDLPQIQDKEWTITVVKDDDTFNAFVLPCGSIFVYSGLLKLCETDDQLGVILGHEMAHAVLGHGAEQVSFLHMLDLLVVIPIAILWAVVPTDLIAALTHVLGGSLKDILFALPYNRLLETEADHVGLGLAAKCCFDVREAPVVWAKMAMLAGEYPIEWLSTHPSSENRQTQLEELIPSAIRIRESCKCPRLPYLDPRSQIAILNKQKIGVSGKTINREELLIPLKI